MNEEDPQPEKVTTEKTKNPGRQEWGRKLGKMSKQLKLEKENKKTIDTPSISKNNKTENLKIKWRFLIGGAGVIIGIAALYYQKKSYEVQVIQNPTADKMEIKFQDF